MAKIKRTIQCDLGGMSIKKTDASIGINADMGGTTLDQWHALLVGSKLRIKIIPAKDVEGQKELFDEERAIELDATSRRMSVGEDYVSASLSIHRDDLDVNKMLKHYCYRRVKIILARTGDAESLSADSDDDVEGQTTLEDVEKA